MINKIIAVDFDGTLCEDKCPDIGAPRTDIIEKLIKEQQEGAYTILQTPREGEELLTAIYWALDKGIAFDAVNEDFIAKIRHRGEGCTAERWIGKTVLTYQFRVNKSQCNKNVSRETKNEGVKTMDFLTELNAQADRVHADLIEAKALLKKFENKDGYEAAYQRGRIEELLKWYESLEGLIDKAVTRRAEERKKILTALRNEQEG